MELASLHYAERAPMGPHWFSALRSPRRLLQRRGDHALNTRVGRVTARGCIVMLGIERFTYRVLGLFPAQA